MEAENMKKIFAFCTALSLMLIACGDDSSSTAPVPAGAESSPAMGVSSSSGEPASSSLEESSSSATPAVSSGTMPESSAINPESSAVGSSSSFNPASSATESSSSVLNNSVQVVAMEGGTCIENKTSGDPMNDGGAVGGDQALPPMAYIEVAEDSEYAVVVVERVKVACNQIGGFAGMIEQPALDSLEISVAGDTLYVKPLIGDSAGTGCTCLTKFFFRVGAESPFMNTSLLVVNDQLNLGNRMQIHNKTAEKKEEQERAAFLERGFKAGRCIAGLDDIPVANKPALFKNAVYALADDDLPEATLSIHDNGDHVLILQNVMDYCGVNAKMSQEMVGDTLNLQYTDVVDVTDCMCTFDEFRFAIPDENVNVRYAKFNGKLYKIVRSIA